MILCYCIEEGLSSRLTLCPLVQISHQLEVPLQFKGQILYALRDRVTYKSSNTIIKAINRPIRLRGFEKHQYSKQSPSVSIAQASSPLLKHCALISPGIHLTHLIILITIVLYSVSRLSVPHPPNKTTKQHCLHLQLASEPNGRTDVIISAVLCRSAIV